MKNVGISIARAAALAVSSRYMAAMDWKVRFAANCIYDRVLKAGTSDSPAEYMRAAGRHADAIIDGTVRR